MSIVDHNILCKVSIDGYHRRQYILDLAAIICCGNNELGILSISRHCPPQQIVHCVHRWPLPTTIDCVRILSIAVIGRNRLHMLRIDSHCRSHSLHRGTSEEKTYVLAGERNLPMCVALDNILMNVAIDTLHRRQ